MKNLPSALMWGGLTLFLVPIALICLFVAVALVVVSPVAGLIFAAIVFVIVRALLGSKKL